MKGPALASPERALAAPHPGVPPHLACSPGRPASRRTRKRRCSARSTTTRPNRYSTRSPKPMCGDGSPLRPSAPCPSRCRRAKRARPRRTRSAEASSQTSCAASAEICGNSEGVGQSTSYEAARNAASPHLASLREAAIPEDMPSARPEALLFGRSQGLLRRGRRSGRRRAWGHARTRRRDCAGRHRARCTGRGRKFGERRTAVRAGIYAARIDGLALRTLIRCL